MVSECLSKQDFSSNDHFPYPRYTDIWFNSLKAMETVKSKQCITKIDFALKESAEIKHPQLHWFLQQWNPRCHHVTRCAGEIAAARDNNVCGVGVAYNSKVAGLRMLDQPFMTDLIETNAVVHMPNAIDIYSASWGPTDYGKTVDGPRNLTMRAIVEDVNEATTDLYKNCTTTHSGTSVAAPEAAGIYALAIEANYANFLLDCNKHRLK
ncbi:NEC2-like protein [Mya arenaria]|uniref:NEC2-like protein n=1 Tax=Mya arenaria TaxID=6604 RepID=A0ABY7FEC2_MYAAR|nr:NEC2-like protein [Mya arenaria]